MIYFIGNKEIGRVKIGFTGDIHRRFSTIKMHSPIELEIILLINGTQENEKSLHKKFNNDWLYGEWFKLSDEINAYINQSKEVAITNPGTLTDEPSYSACNNSNCQYCGDSVSGKTCDLCGKVVKTMCYECHLEVTHDKIVANKDVVLGKSSGPVDIDSDGSWANTVKAYEE